VRVKSQELVEENLQLRVLSVNGLSKDIRHQDDTVSTLHPVSSTWQAIVSHYARPFITNPLCRSNNSLFC